MKKLNFTKLLLPIGLLISVSGFFLRYLIPVSDNIKDFLVGLGVALILSALFLRARLMLTK
jgi:hypothetical protein